METADDFADDVDTEDDEEMDEEGLMEYGGEDDDMDSDYELGDSVEPSGAPPVLQGYLQLAKLYGHDGALWAPPDDIKWDRKLFTLHSDGTLWHTDEEMLGKIDLAAVLAVGPTKGRTNEICLSQSGKCHLLSADPSDSATPVESWLNAIQDSLGMRRD